MAMHGLLPSHLLGEGVPYLAERLMVEKPTTVGFGDFLIWLLLGLVTFGIYTSWWVFSRLEIVYRAAASSKE